MKTSSGRIKRREYKTDDSSSSFAGPIPINPANFSIFAKKDYRDIMKNVLTFLRELNENNNREWFTENKSRYLEAQEEFNRFTERLIDGLASFDPSIRGLTVKECTYRIYRDTRFSPDKRPYKTHMGAYICMHGKKSGFGGYYFHVEPEGLGGLIGGSLLSSGAYLPGPEVVRSIREEILDDGPGFVAALKKARGFRLNQESVLKRTPVGFPADSPYADYFRLKDFYLEKPLREEDILREDLLDLVLKGFRSTKDFLDRINRAIAYAYEEMQQS